MPNRILKKMAIVGGKERTSYDLIRYLLLMEGPKRFGEIKQYLENKKAGYRNNMGLSLALKSMERKGMIRKEVSRGEYPLYHLTDSKIRDTEFLSLEFQLSVNEQIEEAPRLPKQRLQSKEEHSIRRLIQLYGFYDLYAEIKSWEFASTTDSKTNEENRRVWLENTLPMTKHSLIFEQELSRLSDTSVSSQSSSYIDRQKFLKGLEKRLEQIYPDETKFFAKIFNSLHEKADAHRKLVKDVKKRERSEKRQASKNKLKERA